MNRSLYWKITVPFVLVVLLGMGILGFYTVNTVRNTQMDHLRSYLTNVARLVADEALPAMADSSYTPKAVSIAKTFIATG